MSRIYTSPINIPSVCTANATSQAMTHCITMERNAPVVLPSSFFTVPIAATHGVYNRTKTRNTNAVNGVKIFCRAALLPDNRIRVDTTLSLAVSPVIKAVDTLQSLKPRGANTGAQKLPIIARILSSAEDVRFRWESVHSKMQVLIPINSYLIFSQYSKVIPTQYQI